MPTRTTYPSDRARRSLVLAGCAAAMLEGCAFGPKSTTVALTFEATPNANPDARGRPSPVAVRLYELKSVANFDRADFFSLFDRDRETLGPEMMAREELTLRPGERVAHERKVAPDARFLGVLAAFRDLERAQWRLAIPIEEARRRPLVIQLDAARVSVAPRGR